MKFGVHTAENGRSKVDGWSQHRRSQRCPSPVYFSPATLVVRKTLARDTPAARAARRPAPSARWFRYMVGSGLKTLSYSPNLERLVLRCIDSYDSESRRIFQHFSRSTRCMCLCTAQTLRIHIKFGNNFAKVNIEFSIEISDYSPKTAISFGNFNKIFPEVRVNVQKCLNSLRIAESFQNFDRI